MPVFPQFRGGVRGGGAGDRGGDLAVGAALVDGQCVAAALVAGVALVAGQCVAAALAAGVVRSYCYHLTPQT